MAGENEGSGRQWVKGGVLLLGLAAVGGLAWLAIPEEWLEQEFLDSVLQQAGILAPVLYLVVKALVIMTIVPSAPLDVAAGALFGPLLGSIYSLAGSELGALACFYCARRLGRTVVASIFRQDISFCDRCSQRHLALLILFARLEPVFSFSLVSYGAGLTGISLPAFAVATFIGMAPATVALNYYGKSFFSGNVALQVCLGVLLVILMFIVPVWIKRRNPWGLYEKMKGKDDTGS